MPKRIVNLREDLLRYARETLLQHGYNALTVREAATACGVAVGTVYNYFSSKDMLVASVMLQDWQEALRRMGEEAERADGALKAMRGMYQALAAFAHTYGGTWAQYAARFSVTPFTQKWHRHLIEQLCQIVRPMLTRYGLLFHPTLAPFLSETLLTASIDPAGRFDTIAPILAKLLQP